MNTILAAGVIVLAVLLAAEYLRRRRVLGRLRLYEDLFTNLHVGIKVWRLEDADDPGSLRLVASNPAAEQATGVPVEDVLSKTIAEAFPQAVPDGIAETFAQVVRSGKPSDLGEIVYSDARVREGVYTAYAFPLQGDCVGVAFENITKQKLHRSAVEGRARYVQLLQDVAVAANEAESVQHALQHALESICRHTAWPVGHVCLRANEPDSALVASDLWHLGDAERFRALRAATEGMRFTAGLDLPGRVLAEGGPVWVCDVTGELPRGAAMRETGLTTACAFPVMAGDRIAAVLEFFASSAPVPDRFLLATMEQVGVQLGRVIERERAGAAH